MFALIDKWKAAVSEEVQAKRQSRDHSLEQAGNVPRGLSETKKTTEPHQKPQNSLKQAAQ